MYEHNPVDCGLGWNAAAAGRDAGRLFPADAQFPDR